MRNNSQLSGRRESNNCWTSRQRVIAARVKFTYYPDCSLDAHKRMVDSIIIRIHYRGSHGPIPQAFRSSGYVDAYVTCQA
jgi:hypothetical protein